MDRMDGMDGKKQSLTKSNFPRQNLTFPVKIETFPDKIENFPDEIETCHSKKLFVTQNMFISSSFFSNVYHSYSKTLYSIKNPQTYFVETLFFHKSPFIKNALSLNNMF